MGGTLNYTRGPLLLTPSLHDTNQHVHPLLSLFFFIQYFTYTSLKYHVKYRLSKQ